MLQFAATARWLWLLHAFKGIYVSEDRIQENLQIVGCFLITLLSLPVVGLYFSLRCRVFFVALFWTLATTVALPWLAAHGVSPRFIALAPGSIWGTKRWPYYAELAAGLERPCVVVGGAEDRSLADAIVAAAPGRAVSSAGELGLRVSAALIQRAAVLVTNDSAPLHLATAVGTPIVALFGPTVPDFGFGPRRAGDASLGLDGLVCRPCSKHGPETCPLGHHRCMRELAVETVAAALAAITSAEESGAICPRN